MKKTKIIVNALVKYKSRYLIGKRANTKKYSPNQWEFISGFIDTQETAEEIILRELKEETQLNGKIIQSSEPYSIEEETRWIIIPFLIEARSDKFSSNSEDHSELKWVSITELENYKELKSEIRQYKKIGWLK